MIRFHKDDFVDVDRYEERLNYNGCILYDREQMEGNLLYMQSNSCTYAGIAQDTMLFRSAGRYYTLSPDAIYAYLTNVEHCPDHYFVNRKSKTGRPSLDMRKVLGKLAANGYAEEFLSDYMKHRSIESKCSSVKSVISHCTVEAGQAEDGTKLCRIPYTAVRQKNLRFNYNNFDIIAQIPKEYCDCIVAEDGYVLAWGDFAQSDFRIAYNLFLRSRENDRIMLKYKDKYEALARIVAETMGTSFNEASFKEERDIYKVMTLAVIYGTRNSLVKAEQEFIKSFSEFLEKCPKYKEYYTRLQNRVLLGLPLVTESYFGNETVIPYMPYNKDGMVNDALNSPVQTGTSEIIILTVNAILDMFYGLGYTPDDVSVYYVRHDEPIFKIKKETMKDCWIFNQFAEILVDDWIPLELSFNYGYRYKMADDGIQRMAEEVYERNADKIDGMAPGTDIDTVYYPVQDVLILQVHWISTNGHTVVTYYSQEKNQVMYSLLATDDRDEVLFGIKQRIASFSPRVIEAGYRGILIYNNEEDGAEYLGGSYVKFLMEVSPRMNDVVALCKAMVIRYCRKEGIACEAGVQIRDSQRYLEDVQEFSLLIGE